jgi:hypothetical protein
MEVFLDRKAESLIKDCVLNYVKEPLKIKKQVLNHKLEKTYHTLEIFSRKKWVLALQCGFLNQEGNKKTKNVDCNV